MRTGRLRLECPDCLSKENEEIGWVWEGLVSLPEHKKKGQHVRRGREEKTGRYWELNSELGR